MSTDLFAQPPHRKAPATNPKLAMNDTFPDLRQPEAFEQPPSYATTNTEEGVTEEAAAAALLRLKLEMAKSAALTSADNRKILWLAMHTDAWLNCPLMGFQADILAELESRMYPEYDGEKVTFTEWGWQTPEGEIRYLPTKAAVSQPPSTCPRCGGCGMLPGAGPDDDILNTPCPACNEWAGKTTEETS